MIKQRGQIVFDKILDTADRLFYQQGYSNTGINQVIEEADIAKASLYHHFQSKTDILIAYIERTYQRWYQRLQADLETVESPGDKILALFDHHISRQEYREYGGCPFIKANDEAGSSDPRVLAAIQSTKQQLRGIITQLTEVISPSGPLSNIELAETIYIFLEGSVTAGSIFKNADQLRAAKNIVQKLL